MPAAAVKASLVLLIRTQPNNMDHNAYFSLQQQTADYVASLVPPTHTPTSTLRTSVRDSSAVSIGMFTT